MGFGGVWRLFEDFRASVSFLRVSKPFWNILEGEGAKGKGVGQDYECKGALGLSSVASSWA